MLLLADLSEGDLIKILTEPKNALVKQYQKLFNMENTDLVFTKQALAAFAQKAIKRGTGARGLRAIMESVLLDTMYELPSSKGTKKVTIEANHFIDGKQPKIEKKYQKLRKKPAKRKTTKIKQEKVS